MDKADNITAVELKAMKWSGIRHNYVTKKVELWIAGEISKELSLKAVRENPSLLATAFEEAFGLKGHTITMDVTRQTNTLQ